MENKNGKQYNPFKIPDFVKNERSEPKIESSKNIELTDRNYYEIEYDTTPFTGVGKIVLKTTQNSTAQKIAKPENDKIRELFTKMRDIAKTHRSNFDYLRFFDRRVQNDNSVIFYKQGIFMKDFTDNYENNKSFSQYYPYYQMMGYEQLRTYFTWRTIVRNGEITDTSLSYAYLYVYELLANIGVSCPAEGLEKLIRFWKEYSIFNKSISKYIIRWLKDYHIYYELPHSFKAFLFENGLEKHFPELTENNSDFELYCSISKYNIKKSIFFNDNNRKMIIECFEFVMDKIKTAFDAAGIGFENAFFRSAKKVYPWSPFKEALFYDWLVQPDRRVIFSPSEIYICTKNKWTFSTHITSEKGRQFIGYVMKQTESVLRKITNHKFKLSSSTDMIDSDTLKKLTKAGIFIDRLVSAAVAEFHREATKTVVTVDHSALARIREEALATQESLIVEEEKFIFPTDLNIFTDSSEIEPTVSLDPWESLRDALGDIEIQALETVYNGGDIKLFADNCGIMLEVLVDGINEKSMDFVGDNLIDEDFVLYEDYKEKVKEIIG